MLLMKDLSPMIVVAEKDSLHFKILTDEQAVDLSSTSSKDANTEPVNNTENQQTDDAEKSAEHENTDSVQKEPDDVSQLMTTCG